MDVFFTILITCIVSLLAFLAITRIILSRRVRSISDIIDPGKKISSLEQLEEEVEKWQQERKEELERIEQLESYRKEFLGNVSHELKTPIFNIQGYIHTLIDGGLEDTEVNIQYLQRAARSVERLCLIVDDLEAISKLESGEMILEQRTFDITDLVKDVFESLELQAGEKNITLSLRVGSEPSCFVFADKERIRQV